MRARAALFACALAALAPALLSSASAPAGPRAGASQAARIDLRERLEDVRLERDGEHLQIRTGAGPDEPLVDADVWLEALDAAQGEMRAPGLAQRLFHTTDPRALVWIGVGFAGQALFTLRILLQWVTSERVKRSVVPEAFWWSSLGGGVLLLAYFAWREDVVGIAGQSTGVFVYVRNLFLIHDRRRAGLRRRSAAPAGALQARSARRAALAPPFRDRA